MNGVELAIARVIGIEREADEAVGETVIRRHLVKQAWRAVVAVEIQVCSEFSRRFIEDVERAVEVVDEPATSGAAGLFANEVDTREQAHHLAFAVDCAGHRHGGVVAEVERDFPRRCGAQEACEDKKSESHHDFGPSAITKYSARSGPGFAKP